MLADGTAALRRLDRRCIALETIEGVGPILACHLFAKLGFECRLGASAACSLRRGWVRRRADCLGRLLILNCRHLEHVLRTYVEHQNRGHIAHSTCGGRNRRPAANTACRSIHRRYRFGGLIHEYYRAA